MLAQKHLKNINNIYNDFDSIVLNINKGSNTIGYIHIYCAYLKIS